MSNNFATAQQANNRRFEAFRRDNQTVAAWIEYNAERLNSFANSLMQSIDRYGSLTVNQIAAVNRSIEKEVVRSQAATTAPQVSQDKLMEAFDTARQNKLTRLKIRFDGFFCYPAASSSVNAGAVYVKQEGSREYLGKVQNGRFVASRECSAEIKEKVIRVLADPLAEAIAYGKQTGNCAICGRFLENRESVERGIGPICAEKYGFI